MRRIIAAIVTALSLVLGTAVVGAVPANAGGHCRNYVYKRSGTGNCVKAIQVLVTTAANKKDNGRNYFNGTLVLDGKFGANTKKAVMMFQSRAGLKVDGVVGAKTWRVLCNGLYKAPRSMHKKIDWAYDFACE